MISHGIDTLEIGIDISNYKDSFYQTLQSLSELKAEAQIYGNASIDLNNIIFKVHGSGIKFYAYKLSCNDFHIHFCEKELKNNPHITVKFLSSYLWSYGLSSAISNFVTWLGGLNLSIIEIRLSRVDLCADTDEIMFCESDMNNFISRARKRTKFFADSLHYEGKVFSGFNFGSGGTILSRIYNKSIEIKSSQKNWFQEIWKEQGKNNESDVWRIEFQLRRPVLKEFSISSIYDLANKEQDLWSYLTQKWLTMKDPSTDLNVTRWQVNKKWETVQSAFHKFKGSYLVREKVKQGNLPQLLDQMAGLFYSIGAIKDLNNLDSIAKVAKEWANQKLKAKSSTWDEEKKQRIKRFMITENERLMK